ncbi:MAG: STAS domain-containing protein [Candidatus Protistobacter heckmanni]|nr:STAS domain-containing protein [Candidatus Protistobacter heckmanni]
MLVLDSELTQACAAAVQQRGLAGIAQEGEGGALEVDCSALERVDSTALAVMLSWERAARQSGRGLVLRGVPEKLLALAEAYGIHDLLQDALEPAGVSATEPATAG